MSILNSNPAPTDQELLAAAAKNIKSKPSMITGILYNEWSRSFEELWGTRGKFTPAQKLAALGTDAKELFELNTALTQFMISQLTGKRDDLVAKIMEKLATIPAYTINSDGTVTLD